MAAEGNLRVFFDVKIGGNDGYYCFIFLTDELLRNGGVVLSFSVKIMAEYLIFLLQMLKNVPMVAHGFPSQFGFPAGVPLCGGFPTPVKCLALENSTVFSL